MPKYDPGTIDAALADAFEVGIAAAARRHGVPLSLLSFHKRRRKLPIPRRHGGPRRKIGRVDCDLAILRAIIPQNVTLTNRDIAAIIGGISHQALYETEKKALRKIRHRLLEDGTWRESA